VTSQAFLTQHSPRFLKFHSDPEKLFGSPKTLEANLNVLHDKLGYDEEGIMDLKVSIPKTFFNASRGMTFEQFSEFFSTNLGFTAEQQRVILSLAPWVIDVPKEAYATREAKFQDRLGWTPAQSRSILASVPFLYFRDPGELYNINRLFENLFERPSKEITELLLKHPVIYLAPPENIKKTNFMAYKIGLTIPQVYQVVQENPLFVFNKPEFIQLTSEGLETISLNAKARHEFLARNPYILCLSFHQSLARQIRLFRKWGFRFPDIGDIFKLYPFLATKSAESCRKKQTYLFKKFEMDTHKDLVGVKILNYNFREFIFPRGEIMVQKGIKDWKSVLEMDNNTFCRTYGVEKEALMVEKAGPGPEGLMLKESTRPNIKQLRLVSPKMKADLFKGFKLL
jgi:hypothetical protein